MIKAQDLRVGNLVQDSYGRTGTIITLSDKTISVKLQYSRLNTDYSEISPISLTERWMPGYGAEKYNDGVYPGWLLPEYLGFRIRLVFEDGVCFHYLSHTTKLKIPFVHDLQNFYYALTKNELVAEDEPREL